MDYGEYEECLELMLQTYGLGSEHQLVERSLRPFGTSHDGRDINGYVIHQSGTSWIFENREAIIIDCGIHAREWMSPAFCRLFMHELLRCNVQNAQMPADCHPESADLLKFNWYFIPIANPDGYSYTWTGSQVEPAAFRSGKFI